MQITAVIEQLKSGCPLLAQRVFGAVEIATAESASLLTPCAFVVPLSEKADSETGQRRQAVTLQLGIVIVAKNVKDSRGDAAYQDLDAVREQVRVAVLGFSPVSGVSRAWFSNGRLVGFDNLTIRWMDTFNVTYYYNTS